MGLTGQITLLAVAAGLGGAGTMGARALRPGRRLDRRTGEIGVLTAAGISGAGLLAFLGTGRVNGFGVIHLVYLVAVVTVPLLGLTLLVLALAHRRPGVVALSVAALLPAPVGAWATHVAPYRLRVDRADLLLDDPTTNTPVRLGIISDLQTDHVGRHEQEAVDRLLALHPDVILVAGDLFQGSFDAYQRTQRPMQELLGRLEAPGGVFFVRGDVDPLTGPIAVLDGTDITLLDDDVATTEVGNRRLHIGGTMLDWQTPAARRVYRELEAVPDDDIAILLAHRPDVVLDLPVESRVDLTVAGHTHGGQIALPIVGPLVTMSNVPRSVAGGGLHEVAGHPIYVATGIGLERLQAPQVRFLTRPSVTLLTLR